MKTVITILELLLLFQIAEIIAEIVAGNECKIQYIICEKGQDFAIKIVLTQSLMVASKG